MTLLVAFFCLGTIAWSGVSLYLSNRQIAHVAAHRDAVPPDFVDSITMDEHRTAADYTIARERFSRWRAIAETVLTLAWALGGIGLLYGLLAMIMPPSLWRGVAFFVGTSVVGSIVSAPFDIYRAFGLEKRFGFNRMTPATFMLDHVKQALLGVLVGVPLLFVLLWAMRTLTGLWWLYAWAGLLVLMVVAPTIYVRLVAPRFNRFEPLADGPLRHRLESLLARSGFRASGLFTMDASKRTAHGNAYFIGFGRAKRIVLFDTLIAKTTPDEIEAVVAHELGHFLHKHVLFGLVRAALMLLVVLAVFGWLSKQAWLLPAFGIQAHDDALSLYVCMLLLSLVGPISAPLGNWISRKNEYQADDHARRSVGLDPMVSALVKLARDNASTLTPDPLYSLVHHSHPTVPLRVRHMRAMEAVG